MKIPILLLAFLLTHGLLWAFTQFFVHNPNGPRPITRKNLDEFFRSVGQPWKWKPRWLCHRSVWCCQHCDQPNDNH